MTASDTRGYSIRVVAKRCGISAHTLRMWERRYGFPQPARTGGGARRYSDADVERLELIGAALERGYRPHEVVAEDPEVLRRLTTRAPAALASGEGPSVEGALQAVATDDRAGLAQELRRAAAVHGPRAFVSRYLAPLVRGIGEA
ncbi:MAG: MerR family transcriptional regulator, partial [Myxococcales bacterium]|nr:MerR family transcriptional regulator [Myxococcales bacterium]